MPAISHRRANRPESHFLISMQIGRVIGDLSATQKHASHEGKTILLVQPLGLDGCAVGNPVAAMDDVKAGVGDNVLLVYDGFAAFQTVGLKQAPIDTAVIGIIDRVELSRRFRPGLRGFRPSATRGCVEAAA